MEKIALIIIFNHRYEKNIPMLRKIYEGRFSNIFFVMPFSEDLRDESIIHVWEAGYIFEGGIAPAYEKLRDKGFDYFFFLPDDMIINPSINEQNVLQYFDIDKDTALFSKLIPMRDFMHQWPLRMYFDAKDKIERSSGVLYHDFIMSEKDAYDIAEKKGFNSLKLQIRYNLFKNGWWGENIRYILKYPKYAGQILLGSFTFSYPLVNAFSDIFIIPEKYMKDFSRYCGVFGAMNIHCEIAIPTAVLLTCNRIREIKGNNVEHGDAKDYLDKYNGSLDELIANWEPDVDFIHPIKLSGWKYSKEI